ncbi:30S ribosomal protein S2 [Alphaproteobacteria bacterium endosymbiont of Tiliacea citrago]|uniref:30S ribosomal protein S2 n=1 Tax=Alphaproteobacteria bacterium endosymbiont of Tiliacea citrago TaxID=3077944 RepID=UPI00313C9CF6
MEVEKKANLESFNKISIEELFAAGFQYGHKSIKSSPKMKKFVHSIKWGISVIDLCQTSVMFAQALDYLFKVVKKGGSVLFLGTKYQSRDLVQKYAKECGQYYINKRWLGGSITNYHNTILTQIKKLEEIERLEELGILAKYGKKEQVKIAEKKEKLLSLVEGARTMPKLPDLLIVVDAKKEHIALSEAKIAGIPTIVLADTDTPDPSISSHIIPGNDDGFDSVDFFLSKCKSVILEALSQVEEEPKDKVFIVNNKEEKQQ